MSKKDDNGKIIHFPKIKKHKLIKKREASAAKKALNAQKYLEDKHRAEYRAARAKELSQTAQRNAGGKVPFINWDKIPPFTRAIIGVLLLVQIILSFAVSPADKVEIIYYLGFVPAIYSGGVDWSWSALIAPFTTLIIHSGWMHLGVNMVMIMIMGVFFEREFGAKRTAIFFLLSGMAGNAAYLLLDFGSTVPVIGASGAISGLFAVTFMIMIERGLIGKEMQKRGAFPFILLWSTIIIMLGIISNDTSWQSHIGGFLGGAAMFHLWKNKGIIW